MKKIKLLITLLMIVAIAVLYNTNSYADWVYESDFEANIEIVWYDYGDFLNKRPESLTIPLYSETDNVNLERVLYAKDCTITDLGDGVRTKWEGKIKLPRLDSKPFAKDWGIYTLRIPNSQQKFDDVYDSINSTGRMEWDGNTGSGIDFKIEFWPNLNQDYTFNLVFEDDNNRDDIRSLFNKFNITSPNMNFKDENITFSQIGDTYTYSRPLQIYEYDVNGLPVWNNRAEYELEFFENNNHQRPNGDLVKYSLRTEKNGTTITTYASYIPDKLPYDIPVKINFDNEKAIKPENIEVAIKTDKAIYKTSNLNKANDYSYSFTDLYLREDGQEAVYNISLANTADWEFEVTGNQKDGFEINATFIGTLPVEPEKPEVKPEEKPEEKPQEKPSEEPKDEPSVEEVVEVPEEPKPIIKPRDDLHTGGSPYDTKAIPYFVGAYIIITSILITIVLKSKRK